MTKHEAALLLERMVDEGKDLTPEAIEALSMGVDALKGYKPEEWCFGCKEFDKEERYSCPRFNRVIKKAVEALRNNQWIPCSKKMPKEHPSIFDKFKNTERWTRFMWLTQSDKVLVTSIFENGEAHTETANTRDGSWCIEVPSVKREVVAWMPMPDPYQPEPEEYTGCTSDACPIEGVEQD